MQSDEQFDPLAIHCSLVPRGSTTASRSRSSPSRCLLTKRSLVRINSNCRRNFNRGRGVFQALKIQRLTVQSAIVFHTADTIFFDSHFADSPIHQNEDIGAFTIFFADCPASAVGVTPFPAIPEAAKNNFFVHRQDRLEFLLIKNTNSSGSSPFGLSRVIISLSASSSLVTSVTRIVD